MATTLWYKNSWDLYNILSGEVNADGDIVNNTEDVQSMFMGSVPGENFVLTVFRNSKIIDMVLMLGSK